MSCLLKLELKFSRAVNLAPYASFLKHSDMEYGCRKCFTRANRKHFDTFCEKNCAGKKPLHISKLQNWLRQNPQGCTYRPPLEMLVLLAVVTCWKPTKAVLRYFEPTIHNIYIYDMCMFLFPSTFLHSACCRAPPFHAARLCQPP